jgi:hypothetical protein
MMCGNVKAVLPPIGQRQSMPARAERIIVTPLEWSQNLEGFLPFPLGFGFEVRDMGTDMAELNLDIWKRFASEEELDRIKGWSICLVCSYRELFRGAKERLVEDLMHYVVAHLRFIVPNRAHADRFLRANVVGEKLDPLTISPRAELLLLEECEQMCSEIQPEHLEKLKSWMPWIMSFKRRWKAWYPLYLSLYFAEMARAEDDARIRHVLRVMALEALFSTEKTYGLRALQPKLPKLLGPQIDIYEQYRNNDQPFFPPLILLNVLRDVCTLRNKVAHGDTIPDRWLTRNCRYAMEQQLNYCEELLEASTGMLASTWRAIIDGGLQAEFGTKGKMEAYFRSLDPRGNGQDGG